MTFKADIITFLPEAYPGILGTSLVGKALKDGRWELNVHSVREFADNKSRSVDDTPAGGGPGMVLRPDVAARAFDAIQTDPVREIIYASPAGEKFSRDMAHEWAASPGKIFLCGRYEGVDQRVLEKYNVREVSLGDFVLCGGDVAVQAMLEATVRLIGGTIGNHESAVHESFENQLLEHAQYTRPSNWDERKIPDVLLSGNHAAINKWRLHSAEQRTQERRPDLWTKYKK